MINKGIAMVLKSIFEILEEKYDIEQEFNVINRLFSEPNIITYEQYGEGKLVPIEIAINSTCFYSWKQRRGCISLADMREKLELNNVSSVTKSDMITYLEYFCNIIYLANKKLYYTSFHIQDSHQKTQQFIMLEDNINILLDHLNYEKQIFEEEEKVILIPKNPAATAAAEISSKDTAMAILKYHHASLKGQIEEKRRLLLSIANEYETLLTKPISGFSDYFDKATNMLNNLNIRHNNKVGKNKKDYVANMKDEDLERWYDELYQLLLFCILIKDNKERKNKITELLKMINKECKDVTND